MWKSQSRSFHFCRNDCLSLVSFKSIFNEINKRITMLWLHSLSHFFKKIIILPHYLIRNSIRTMCCSEWKIMKSSPFNLKKGTDSYTKELCTIFSYTNNAHSIRTRWKDNKWIRSMLFPNIGQMCSITVFGVMPFSFRNLDFLRP